MASVADELDGAQRELLVQFPCTGGATHHILAAVHDRHRDMRNPIAIVQKLRLWGQETFLLEKNAFKQGKRRVLPGVGKNVGQPVWVYMNLFTESEDIHKLNHFIL